MPRHLPSRQPRSRFAAPGLLAAAGLGLVLAACGSSSPASVSSGASQSAAKSTSNTSTTAPAASSGADAAVTFKTADVPGLGTVLVNGEGRTIYILTSEAGGKITCTDANGCTKYWPDTELPSGMMHPLAGPGVDASKLATTKSSDGSLYSTYAGYPLYTFAGDSGPGQKNGQGVKSFGGAWYAIAPSGALVTGTGSTSTTAGQSAAGYGY